MTYQSKDRDEDALRHDIIKFVKIYGRHGYRKIAQLLRISGWKVNHKKVERIWREEELQLPERHKGKSRLYYKDFSIIRMRPNGPNHVWAVDFVHDKLSNNRPYKMLTVGDEYTRQALAVHVPYKMSAADVLEALYPILIIHGKPHYIRSNNGPEFTAEVFQTWLIKVGISQFVFTPARHGKMAITRDLTET